MNKNEDNTLRYFQQELGDGITREISLSDYTRVGVGGKAKYFYVSSTIDDLTNAIGTAFSLGVPYQVVGEGNDIVPSDAGYEGLIVKNVSSNIVFSPDMSEVVVDSGVGLSRLINLAASRDMGGLEFLAGMPGTVGGAVYGNYGVGDYALGDYVKSATVLMERQGELIIGNFPGKWMNFGPSTSKLKETTSKFRPVILTVRLQLARRRKDEILSLIQDSLLARQAESVGDQRAIRNFFKQPSGKNYPPIDHLLNEAGVRRVRIGGAGVSKRNLNAIINLKNATSSDVWEVAQRIKELVAERFGFALEERVEYLGKW
ncbi:MAG: UDP-N-acetylenolpyruvoylglucosamine reductase [bacterium ADurb.Bin400]|nr:MAG: UDP-N-acetylenolpyruvoylglucosamine reductase [bacterium ADurb.Bin400]